MTALACVATAAGRLDRFGWLCELASHFRAQYAGVLLLGAVVLSFGQRSFLAAAASGCALTHLAALLPFYWPRGRKLSGACPSLRVVLANVLHSNRSYQRMQRFLREANADVVILQEMDEQGLAALTREGMDYPFSTAVFRSDSFSIALLSRRPLEQAESVSLGGAGVPSLVARVPVGSAWLTILATHPVSPVTPDRVRLRNEQFERLTEFVAQQDGPVMVIGDLNTTSWTAAFQLLLRRSRLRDSRLGFGLQPSWPAGLPWLRIPLDHCLVSPGVVVSHRALGTSIGSDHLPIIVDVGVELEKGRSA